MKKRILVVDDEPYIQEVAQICLEMLAGWTVITASSGTEAIAKAELEQPDAILLDVLMPDMDGMTTFSHLQANPATQAIPVLMLSAKAQSSDAYPYKAVGIKAAIAKPFDPLTLANQIAQVLGWSIPAA